VEQRQCVGRFVRVVSWRRIGGCYVVDEDASSMRSIKSGLRPELWSIAVTSESCPVVATSVTRQGEGKPEVLKCSALYWGYVRTRPPGRARQTRAALAP
jgi:hypothetical protein